MPRVSVVMPVYNGATYLEPAVRSVLDQTMRDLELVVVDDGSSDDSLGILERLADEDDRIRIDAHGINQGHHVASNRAIELAGGELIVRHDQDDLLMPGWIDLAAQFLDDNVDVGLLGGAYRHLSGEDAGRLRRPPASHTEIRVTLLFKNVFCHPGIVIRSDLRESGELEYRDFAGPQDYDLWVRLLQVTRGANLPEQVVLYRRHETTMSAAFESDMPSEVERISDRQLEELLGADTPGLDGLRAMRRLWRGGHLVDGDLAYVASLNAVFEAMETQHDISVDVLDTMRSKWIQRVMSGSLHMTSQPPWRLMRAEPRDATRWVFGGLSRSASVRLDALRTKK